MPPDDPTRPGIEEIGRAIDAAPVYTAPAPPTPGADNGLADPPDCPVIPLGHDDGTYVFLSPSGMVRRLMVREMTPLGLTALFDGDSRWMIAHFQKHDQNGNPQNDFVARGVAGYLIRRCVAAGVYDAGLRIRGVGVWRGPAGSPLVHCGDQLWHEGGVLRPGLRGEREIYAARPRVVAPAFDNPATAADALAVRDGLRLWSYRRRVDAGIVFGWLGQALLGGLPGWRVHLCGTAEHGSGKTWLLKLLGGALGPMGFGSNDFSEAGLRSALTNQARVLILDEAENNGASAGRVQAVIELIRRMSGDEGANVVRGSSNQTAHHASVTGCGLMMAINPPVLKPQDRSRIFDFDLRKVTADPDKAERVERAAAMAAALSPRLRARAVLNWRVFAEAAPVWRRAVIGAGCDGRQADMLAALLAGRDLLLCEAPPDSDSIAETLPMLAGLIAGMRQADEDDGDAQQCWGHLLGHVPDLWRNGTRQTIGQMIADALTERDFNGVCGAALRVCGLRLVEVVEEGKPPDVALCVANKHAGLNKVFLGEPAWMGGGWARSLRRLGDDVRPHVEALRFAGVLSRCIAIPGRHLPRGDDWGGDGGGAEA